MTANGDVLPAAPYPNRTAIGVNRRHSIKEQPLDPARLGPRNLQTTQRRRAHVLPLQGLAKDRYLKSDTKSGAFATRGVNLPASMDQSPPDDPRRFAPATLRNRDAILAQLRIALPASGLVLELASGTGEHAAHFARHLPHLEWQPSDPSPGARLSIAAWLALEGLSNVRLPLDIDAAAHAWPIAHAAAALCINMIHISPWASTIGLLRGASRILPGGAPLILYGPFRRSGMPLEPSNEAFDRDLRARDPSWGLRQLDEVARCAAEYGLLLDQVIDMPANNVSVIFRREQPVR